MSAARGVANPWWILALAAGLAAPAAQPAAAQWTVRPGTSSPGGFSLSAPENVFLAQSGDTSEESWLALNADNATLLSPGDGGLLRIFEQDSGMEYFRFEEDDGFGGINLLYPDRGDAAAGLVPRRITVGDDNDLEFYTNGALMSFFADADGDTSQSDAFLWYGNGVANQIMALTFDGNLAIDGALTQGAGPELAVIFLRAEAVQPGELVAVSADRADAVRRTAGAGDPGVLGAVSARPGVALGGAGLTAAALEQRWGPEVAARFREQRAALQAQALAADRQMAARAERLSSLAAFAAGRPAAKPGEDERLAAAFDAERARLARDLERAALGRFVAAHFAAVVVAGRVAVRAEAAGGAISPGDALAPGPTPGTAVRATGPGPVVGIALEPLAAGSGTISMWAGRGGYGREAAELAAQRDRLERDLAARDAELAALRRQRDLEVDHLAARLAALERRLEALSGEPRIARASAPLGR